MQPLFTGPHSLREPSERVAFWLTGLGAFPAALLIGYVLHESIGASQVALFIVIAMLYVTLARGRLLGSSVRIHQTQYPRVFSIVQNAAAALEIPTPLIFVREDNFVPAVALGLGAALCARALEPLDRALLRRRAGLCDRSRARTYRGRSHTLSLVVERQRQRKPVDLADFRRLASALCAHVRQSRTALLRLARCGDRGAGRRNVSRVRPAGRLSGICRAARGNCDRLGSALGRVAEQRAVCDAANRFDAPVHHVSRPIWMRRPGSFASAAKRRRRSCFRAKRRSLPEIAPAGGDASLPPASMRSWLSRSLHRLAAVSHRSRASPRQIYPSPRATLPPRPRGWAPLRSVVKRTRSRPADLHLRQPSTKWRWENPAETALGGDGLNRSIDAIFTIVGQAIRHLGFFFWFPVYLTLLVVFAGQTFGMMIAGLRVVTIDFRKPSVGRTIWRYIIVFLVWWLIVALSFFWRRILLHDRLTKTRVVKVERVIARSTTPVPGLVACN